MFKPISIEDYPSLKTGDIIISVEVCTGKYASLGTIVGVFLLTSDTIGGAYSVSASFYPATGQMKTESVSYFSEQRFKEKNVKYFKVVSTEDPQPQYSEAETDIDGNVPVQK